MIIKISLTVLLTIFSNSALSLTFNQAKKELKVLYKDFPSTFYCGCDIEWISNSKLVPNPSRCGYSPRKPFTRKGNPNERATRIEFEHVVSAYEFGHQLQCWQEGKRKHCIKTSDQFNVMEGDLHNLTASLGELNNDRSNYRFGIIEGESRIYGQCDAEVDFQARVFEPRPSIRGDIARTYFYFEQRYGLKISRKQQQLFSAWDKLDPVDSTECAIHNAKAKIQGNENPFVSRHCL